MTDTHTNSLFPTYAKPEILFTHGQGNYLYTKNDDAYLDFTSGIAVNSLGHAHPRLVEALKKQADQLWHVSNLYRIEPQEKLAQKLVEHSFADHVFFTNSGAEALECAIKTARRYFYANNSPEKFHIITFEGAFHGRTLATIAAGGKPAYLEGFGPALEGFDQVPFADIEAVEEAITPQTAAVLVEPVQGEGGVNIFPPEKLKALRALCDTHGLLLILDEVQTGAGRSGHLFAHEISGITPDIMAVAKGIGGGFPLGGCLATHDCASVMVPGTHGSTFGGNPLACAVGLEGIRGEGLLLGLALKMPVADFNTVLFEQKMLAPAAANDVLRLLPALNTTPEELDEACQKISEACQHIRNSTKTD